MQSSLDQYLQKLSKVHSEKHALYIFKQIATAVDYIHSQNVMHCDIKLENILVNYNEDLTITELVIADFGLAIDLTSMKLQKQAHGSLPYIAPELFL